MKQRTMVAAALALCGVGGLAAAGPAGRPAGAEDDLAIVKKAVASPSPVAAREPRPVASVTASARAASGATPAAAQAAAPAPASEVRPLPRSGREPRWFKVRIVERSSGRKRVTVNLPLSLVRALGDDTFDWGCREGRAGERCHTMRISDVLQSLEAGQELVEIEDEDSTVKVWVE